MDYVENKMRLFPLSRNLAGVALPLLSVMMASLPIALNCAADAPGPGMVYPKTQRRVVQRPAPVVSEPMVAPVAEPRAVRESMVTQEEEECWGVRLAAGVPVWFFDKESNLPGAGAYVDFYSNAQHINLRVGVEGRHMFLGQDEAASASEFEGKTPRITYIRIPFSVEYILATDMKNTQLFIGGGPDIVRTANDITSTSVGGHLSARLLYTFYENWGVAVEGGYMWGEARRSGKDVNLDGAYVTPTLNYTF